MRIQWCHIHLFSCVMCVAGSPCTPELNYMGTVNTLKAVTPGMVARRNGTILIVSSGLALTAYMGYSAYSELTLNIEQRSRKHSEMTLALSLLPTNWDLPQNVWHGPCHRLTKQLFMERWVIATQRNRRRGR